MAGCDGTDTPAPAALSSLTMICDAGGLAFFSGSSVRTRNIWCAFGSTARIAPPQQALVPVRLRLACQACVARQSQHVYSDVPGVLVHCQSYEYTSL